ncbi:diaminopimelate epimerase [Jannaschia aquimarina]|uniref:Diaminopimelate epimerase n=1 Tax=Jannaschia aquimarina TaxID=935700 RepID=A0A0D1CJU7_9RHOB|nr:diaminopimelate epimerase [Jannaschia aquimarina]KIT15012.1 Diaminopimelate epimerase [Jannaschia aquimarina]SNS61927.1 diaminopimelate epimerase [Jannaschia aquimarina]
MDQTRCPIYVGAMNADTSSGLPFMKMHGLGNDFVVIDGRGESRVDADLARAMGDRHRGVGFDQLAFIEGADDALRLTFYNADGSTSAACGNATRCIAAWEMDRRGSGTLDLLTERGALRAERRDGVVAVNMGAPILDWREIPLAHEICTLHLPIAGDPVATGMGNPHCTFFVDDAEAEDLSVYGAHETHDLFPQRTNVQIASVVGPDHLRVRVWERGVGPTLASGSSSCAVTVAAARRGITGRAVRVDLDGGTLMIDWREDGVWMSGPTSYVFDGVWYG